MPRADESLRRLSEALREISPDEPALVSLRRFDASDARRRLGLPTGRGLRSRFRLGWGRLCIIAVTGGDQAQALNASLRDRAKPPTRTEIHFALRTIAARLGQETVGQTEYERERKKMHDEQSHSYRHGLGCPMPSANQMLGQGTWQEMLEHAKLPAAGHKVNGKGTPVEDLIKQFARAFKATPSRRQLHDWAKASGVSVARGKPGYAERIELAREKLAEQGDAMPPRDPALNGAELAQDTQATGDGPARRKRWSLEDVLAGLVLATDELPAGQSLTQDRLLELSVGHRDIPSPGAVGRIMKKEGLTFAEIKAKALATTD